MTTAILTFITAIALRASDPAVAVAAVAGAVVLLGWYAQLASDDERGGLDALGPQSAVTLAVVGRRPVGDLLPAVTAHVVGAVVAGFAALGLESHLPEPLPYDADALVVAGVGAAVVGLVAAWATLAVDGGGPVALTAVPVVVAGSLPLALVSTFSPAVVIGLATADLLPWDVAGVAAAAGLVAATVGAYLAGLLVPASE